MDDLCIYTDRKKKKKNYNFRYLFITQTNVNIEFTVHKSYTPIRRPILYLSVH